MKKRILAVFIILGIILCISFCVVTNIKNAPKVLPTGEIEYDFSKQSQSKANKILYKYVLEDLNKTPKELEEQFKITPNVVRAFEYDLNDDRQNEVIGIIYSLYYCGTAGCSFFILEKAYGKYKDISNVYFQPSEKMYISPQKTNGYKKVIFYNPNSDNSTKQYIQHNGNYFSFIFPEKQN